MFHTRLCHEDFFSDDQSLLEIAVRSDDTTGHFKNCCLHVWINILMWLEVFSILANLLCIFLVNYFVGNIQDVYYWNALLSIGVYIGICILFHALYAFLSRPWKSTASPHHLIVIIPGWIGFHIRQSHLREMLKSVYLSSGTTSSNVGSFTPARM